MPLWVAPPRHQTLVYIIFACVHTTRKDVRSIYHIYVAYVRTCIYVYFVHLFFNADLHRSISFDLVTVEFLFYPSTVGSLLPLFHSKRTTGKMSAKNGDIVEQQEVRGWSMLLWVALPRHQTLVYIICACVHTTRKDVRSIYHIHVAYIRTCTYVYFVHLFFNSDLPSIYLIRSGDGRISSSILPQ